MSEPFPVAGLRRTAGNCILGTHVQSKGCTWTWADARKTTFRRGAVAPDDTICTRLHVTKLALELPSLKGDSAGHRLRYLRDARF